MFDGIKRNWFLRFVGLPRICLGATVIPPDLFVCLWINLVRLGEYVLPRSRNAIVLKLVYHRLIINLC